MFPNDLLASIRPINPSAFGNVAPQQPQQPQMAPQGQPRQAEPDRKAVAWADRNEWFGKDKGMTFTAMAFHEELINQEGFDGKSDEYYNELDKRIQKEFPHKSEGNKDRVAESSKRLLLLIDRQNLDVEL